MKQCRIYLIAFLVMLILFFNIERFNFGEPNVINLDTFVYVIGAGVILLIFALPILSTWHPVMLIAASLGIYLLLKLWGGNDQPLFGGTYTYLLITELAFLTTLVWLAQASIRPLKQFEQAVEHLSIAGDTQHLVTANEATEVIETEMFRSRHQQNPLSIIVVEAEAESFKTLAHQAVQEVQQKLTSRYMLNYLGRALRSQLRPTDRVLSQTKPNSFVVLCPHTNANEAMKLAQHIRQLADVQLDLAVKYSTATFPDEALTFEDLLRRAETNLQNSPRLCNSVGEKG